MTKQVCVKKDRAEDVSEVAVPIRNVSEDSGESA